MKQLIRSELRPAEAYHRPTLRFLTASKFFTLISRRAVWFSRLGALEDQFEGCMPTPTKRRIQTANREWEPMFPHPEHRHQLREEADRNERDGRNMLAVSCWFADTTESVEMWQKFVGATEGVAIESSCELLASSIAHQEYARIGLVRYVDFEKEDMGLYLGNQGIERAFLKRLEYSSERELRIATLNFIAPNCLGPDGEPPKPEKRAGLCVFDPHRPGFFIRANVGRLVRSVRLSPGASDAFAGTVQKVITAAGLSFSVKRSSLE